MAPTLVMDWVVLKYLRIQQAKKILSIFCGSIINVDFLYIDRQQYWKCDRTIDICAYAHGKQTRSTNSWIDQLTG